MLRFLVFTTALSFPLAAVAQDAATAPPDTTPAVREGADPVAAFLSRKAEAQARSGRSLEAMGRGGDVGQLRALSQAARIAPPGLGRNAAERAALEASLATDVIQMLASLGLNPGEVRRMQALGFDPFAAASELVRGSATPLQQAALSEWVVVGEVASNEIGGPADGFGSTLVLTAVDVLKGDLAVGAPIRLRQRSGAESSLSSDLSGEPGTRYILFLSNSLYQREAAETGGRPDRDHVVQVASAYRIDGDLLQGTASGQPRPVPLASLRTGLAPLAAAGRSGV